MSSHIISVVIPCLNEHEALPSLLEGLMALDLDLEIVVVDDGSTPPLSPPFGVTVFRHPQNMGNGAAIKTGARKAKGDILVFMDADGQHDPNDIPKMVEQINQGFDMVVGARDASSQATITRRIGNLLYNQLASLMTGFKIDDLTSGFRAARANTFRKFLYLLPNGFSYPATSTMAFFRCGHVVGYIPIKAAERIGTSKIRIIKDGFRFLIIIVRIGTLFSPMRLFLPIAFVLFGIATLYYGYTFTSANRFTNMSAVLYISSLFTFLFGIVSEQVSALHYRYSEKEDTRN